MKKITLVVTILIGIVNNLQAQINLNLNGEKNLIENTNTSSDEELFERFKGSNNIDKNQFTTVEQFRLSNYLKTKFQNRHLSPTKNNSKNPEGTNAYCGPLVFPTAVEPITLVDFAGINNATNATINGTPSNEDFTAIIGNVYKETNYTITLEGNTNGNNTNRFVVFIDWNQNEIFDDPGEVYEISETITNSTGSDGIQATGDIYVPYESEYGPTRMRIKKILGTTDYLNPCLGADNGQAEDYTINVNFISETRLYTVSNRDHIISNIKPNFPNFLIDSGSSSLTNENAGAIDPNETNFGYVFNDAGDFYKVDMETITYTQIGNIPGNWVGAEFDTSTGVLYAITTTELYVIDPIAVTASLVGPLGFTNGEKPVALGIDGGSVGYTFDVEGDNSYSIDLNTGTASLIGPMQREGSYEGGMAYDIEFDVLFIIMQYAGTNKPMLGQFNKTTGKIEPLYPLDVVGRKPSHGWLSAGISYPPAACAPPEAVQLDTASDTVAYISWIDWYYWRAVNGYSWELYYQNDDPATATPVQTGQTGIFEWGATIEGLEEGYNYDFYVSVNCADGVGNPSHRLSFQTNRYIPQNCADGRKYLDEGGANGNYHVNESQHLSVFPENSGEGAVVTFLDFDVLPDEDALYIYNGPNEFAPQFDSGNPATSSGFPAGGFYGTDLPGTFKSTHPTGRLTFIFRSDAEGTARGWEAEFSCYQLRPENDLIENAIDVDEMGFPYRDPQNILQWATEELENPIGCSIFNKKGVWYKFIENENSSVTASVINNAGETNITFYTAPNENASITDLTFVDQPTNYCDPSNTSTITTVAGQAYYVYAVNTGGPTDVLFNKSTLSILDNNIEGFNYYPNPTTGLLYLKAIDNINNVSIYNLLGQKVITKEVQSMNTQIDLSGLTSSIYLMQVEVNGQTGTYKIVKE